MAEEKKQDRIGLRLYNTIVIYDVYMAARSSEAARAGLLAIIRDGDTLTEPTEIVAKEVTMANSIRQSWVDQTPWVASDVTDDEFESVKGNTVGELYAKLYSKSKK